MNLRQRRIQRFDIETDETFSPSSSLFSKQGSRCHVQRLLCVQRETHQLRW